MIGPQKQGAPRDAAPRDARAVVCTSAASGASGKGAEAMESAGGVVFRDKKAEALADLDGRIGLLEAFPFGLQHVLAMFVANLAPIAIIVAAAGLSEDMRAVLIQNAMLIAGIGTFIQLYPLWRVGSGLSIVMGISFTFVTVACTVAATQGYGALIGAVIVGGVHGGGSRPVRAVLAAHHHAYRGGCGGDGHRLLAFGRGRGLLRRGHGRTRFRVAASTWRWEPSRLWPALSSKGSPRARPSSCRCCLALSWAMWWPFRSARSISPGSRACSSCRCRPLCR